MPGAAPPGCGTVMAAPKRIQRKRSKGWKMPPGTVFVGRPTKWGNPFVVGRPSPMATGDQVAAGEADPLTPAEAVECFRALPWGDDELEEIRGKDLACWCPMDRPCHADVLLELANT